ncbi:hypothetical protein [Bradyrhizobium sp. 174]|uniref:hypothetical protein n=1 Tax=Bradyrhizobium sp. 174 TaxID=2782645 RepID=UPI001FFA39C5|nr:hypothetical protein [Bradyrhizobium sp. 174]MCK1570801.1 hypothetical protein [Bradyrhizobium sp. 174]
MSRPDRINQRGKEAYRSLMTAATIERVGLVSPWRREPKKGLYRDARRGRERPTVPGRLTELANFKPFQAAEKAVASNLALLEERMVELPKPTANVIEFMTEQEIRAHINKQRPRLNFVLKSISDQRLTSAVLNAPCYLSGLNDVEWNVVRERARAALHPQQAEMQQWLRKALAEAQEGLAATKRMLLERCQMREDDDGQFRSIREAVPRRSLTP